MKNNNSFKKKIYSVLLLTILALTACISSGCFHDDKRAVLNIYSWADYYDPSLIEEFEKKYNCEVTYDVYGNNEELLAKLEAGNGGFDLIQPSDYMVTTLLKLNMLEPLEHEKIPNIKYVAPALKSPAYDKKMQYAVPYVWGLTGIVYNKRYVKDTPHSWEALWNPAYKGHVVLLNDSREVLGLALKKHAYSVNCTDPDRLHEVMQDLTILSDNILSFDTENIKPKFIAEDAWIGEMWSGDAAFCYAENKEIAFVVPEEGTIIWTDNMAIPKGAKHKELAEKFINFMYDPKISARNFNYIKLPNANSAAWKYMDKEVLENPVLQTAQKFAAQKGEWIQDVGESIEIYDRLWTELRTH